MSLKENLKILGPGIAIAATGVGAGDLVTAAVAGAKYGTIILWAALVGAVMKFALNEGIARWQLATGTTVLEGWSQKLHPVVSYIFFVYLVLWSFIVAGALIAACGLAGFALFGRFSVKVWGIIHSLIALAFVYFRRYARFENLMKAFIGLMFGVVIISAAVVRPEIGEISVSLWLPRVPEGAGKFLLGVIGGVGGSVTLLNYGYWIREKNWQGSSFKHHVNLDLGVAYLLTGGFGVAIMIIAAGVNPQVVQGNQIALEIAGRLESILGPVGRWAFLAGFWGAVFSSMVGVWQGVPYLFSDFVSLRKTPNADPAGMDIRAGSTYYRLYLLYLGIPPISLLFVGRPVFIVVIYAIAGALFMPFLAATLLYMNNRKTWVGRLRNPLMMNILLGGCLLLFGYISLLEIFDL